MAKKKKDPNFDEAYLELQEIHEKIQDESVSIEEIAQLIRRSSELIQYCKDRLKGIESDIDKAFQDEH